MQRVEGMCEYFNKGWCHRQKRAAWEIEEMVHRVIKRGGVLQSDRYLRLMQQSQFIPSEAQIVLPTLELRCIAYDRDQQISEKTARLQKGCSGYKVGNSRKVYSLYRLST